LDNFDGLRDGINWPTAAVVAFLQLLPFILARVDIADGWFRKKPESISIERAS